MEAGSDAFQRQLAAIRDDRVHGAALLAQRAIWALAQAATAEGATTESVREAAALLSRLRPDMVSVANGVQLLLDRLHEAEWALSKAPALATGLIAETQEWAERAAGHAALLIPEGGLVLTCSYSATVVLTLATAWRHGRRFQAHVLPSAGHGTRTAEEAGKRGVEARVVDTLPRNATAQGTVGLIGADAISPSGSVVNGAPSLGLARWCADRGLPFYVVCDSLKKTTAAVKESAPLPHGVERISARYITALITEARPRAPQTGSNSRTAPGAAPPTA